MGNDEIVIQMEVIVMDYAGPIGKFVVRKQIGKDLYDLDNLSDEEKKKLIKKIIAASIFNDLYQEACSKKLLRLLIQRDLEKELEL